MDRFLLPALVVASDVAIFATRTPPVWALIAYAAGAIVLAVVARRWPLVAFGAVLVLGPVVGSAFVLLLWTAYLAGRATRSRAVFAVAVALALAGFAARPGSLRSVPSLVVAVVVFVLLPMLVGRYLARQHEERLRLARDVHDSLGRRLSLVSVQAAALEVTSTVDISGLTAEVRGAIDDLHGLVGSLRDAAPPDIDAAPRDIEAVLAAFTGAGVVVTVRRRGRQRPLSTVAGQAVRRVVEEGLTNAVRHAPGEPVTVEVTWEPDGLLLSVTNALSRVPAVAGIPAVAGNGLVGLRERCVAAGGLLEHRSSGAEFRLFAMLPVVARRRSAVGLGVAVAVLMFVVLPAAMLLGAR